MNKPFFNQRYTMHKLKNILEYARDFDMLSKVGMVILASTLTYVVLLFILKPVFIPQSTPFEHFSMMGNHMMSFESPQQSNLNITALIGAVLAGALTALFLGKKPTTQEEKVNELSIIKKVLSTDEKKIISIIEEAGEITQDSLTFRLEWSRAKVSTLLTNLEKINIIQRKREGKTYTVFLTKEK